METKERKRVILASASPRRREMLKQIGLDFSVEPADVDEQVLPREHPESYALRVARDKARVAAAKVGAGVVIAADTIVVLDDQILGKPVDALDAERMLALLSDRQHQVITGLVLTDAASGASSARTSVTGVWFRQLTSAEITSYVRSGEPLDKAGSYGIQGKGALLVKKIEGCYFNVVGLPLSLLGEMLPDFGIRLW